MDKCEIEKRLKKAEKIINFSRKSGNKRAYTYLKPLIKRNIPEALCLYSMFSTFKLGGGKETYDEFMKRRVRLLKKSAELGCVEAMYQLALLYYTSEPGYLEQDCYLAAIWFKEAALHGDSLSKIEYAYNLFYGSYGIEMDKELALSFMQQAVDEGVEGAEYDLAKLKKEMQENSSKTPESSL